MVDVKTPTLALYLKKVDSEYEQQNEKFCSRTTISCFFAVILVALVVVVSVQFFYPAFNQKLGVHEERIVLSGDQTIEVRLFPMGNSEADSNDKDPDGMNPWDLNFLMDPVDLCITVNSPNSYQYQLEPEVKLLMLVPSAVDHFDQRRAIRNTWGSVAESPRGPMRLGFVLGTSDNPTVRDLVQEESAKFADIIQADIADDYHHLTTKSVLMLKWVAKRCPHAQYFLKADDDTFLNLAVIADILGSEPFISQEKFIGGYVHTGAHPTRIPQEKYYISDEDYPVDKYPPYALGSAYVMTGPTAVELFDASREVEPFLQLEDVFVTGLCADYIHASRIHEPRFKFDDPPSPPSWDAFSSLASAHSVTPDNLEVVWNDMIQSVPSLMKQLFDQQAAINSTVAIRLKRNL